IELGECLGDQAIRRAMIGKQIVADAMPAGTPEELIAVQAEKIAGLLHMRPVTQLEGGMEVSVGAGLHQINGVMIGAAAQEREEVAHPIGFAKAEHVAVELGDLLDVGDMKRDVTELVWDDSFRLEFLV